MPWPVYRNMTDEDLKAIFAYLKTIPPVSNHVPDPVPPDEVAKIK
jgi:mono/diheme cytochrome c family protein